MKLSVVRNMKIAARLPTADRRGAKDRMAIKAP
jgi:hypothetical protein